MLDIVCYRIRGTIKAESPLHVGSGRRVGVIKRSLPYIPGSFLRGSVGVCLLKATCKKEAPIKNHEECEYWRDCVYASLMEEEKGRQANLFFRYSYPLHLPCSSGIYEPVSMRISICNNPQCGAVYSTFVPPRVCEKCSKPDSVKQARGFRCTKCGKLQDQTPVNFCRVTSTGIDRSIQSAAQIQPLEGGEKFGTLHVLEFIEAETKFGLEIVVDKDYGDRLDVLLNILKKGVQDEGLGGAKSRGFGKVRIEAEVETVRRDDLKMRADGIDPKDFCVRLVSPMILDGGEALGARTLLEGVRRAYSWAYGVGKPSLPDVELVEKRFSNEYVSGWSLRDDKRRRVEAALTAGSVFHYRSEGSRELADGLAALEMFSIGAYKPHGCGQVRIEAIR